MLIFARKPQEVFLIGDPPHQTIIEIVEIRGDGTVRLGIGEPPHQAVIEIIEVRPNLVARVGITAPPTIHVRRGEVPDDGTRMDEHGNRYQHHDPTDVAQFPLKTTDL